MTSVAFCVRPVIKKQACIVSLSKNTLYLNEKLKKLERKLREKDVIQNFLIPNFFLNVL